MRLLTLLLFVPSLIGAERINHAGRILGPLPVISTPVLFNTAQADAIVAAMQIMPRDNSWNEVITNRPVHVNSANIMARIRADLVAVNATRHTLRIFSEMNYVLVPTTQPLVGIRFTEYPDDSDFNGGTNPIASWPVPAIMPIETWPSGRPADETLAVWQRTVINQDRHSIVVQLGATPRLFETWQAVLTNNTPNWQASNGALFSLNTNTLRANGLTSGDAAGLPMFPALIRYDECERGVIEHALRIVVNKSRKEYIYPATHHASSIDNTNPNFANYPAMGQRVRLKSSFSVPTSWTKQSKAVANALKTYGALVADNGGFFSVSACPDQRFPANCFANVQTLDINQFEIVTTTGVNEGPRAANAPSADAGVDQNVQLAVGAILSGSATGSGITTNWSLYDSANAPGSVTIAAPTSASSAVTFSAAGTYTFLLSISDDRHNTAFDAMVVTVLSSGGDYPAPTLTDISPSSVTAGSGAFTLTLNGANLLPSSVVTWTGHSALLPLTATSGQLTVTVPARYVTDAGVPNIMVVNPAPGGGTSLAQTMVITASSDGEGSTDSGGASASNGGCGLGGTIAAFGAFMLVVLLRRE